MLTQQQIQQFRVRAKQQGFSDAQIEAEIFRKNKESMVTQTKVAPTQAPVSQPMPEKKSFGGLIKNAGQDLLDFAVNSPVQAAKNVAGVGFELGRAIDVARGKNDKAINAKNPFIDINNIPSLKQLGTGILKNIGNTLGIKQGADGNMVFDLNLALQSAYERPVTTALMAKDLGGGAKKLLTKGSAKDVAESAVAKPNAIEKLGSNMRKEVLNPQVKADPFYSENVKALQAVQKKLGLKGSAEVQLDQLPGLFKKTQTEIRTQLAKSKSPEKGVLSSNFDSEVAGANYNIANKEFAKAIDIQRQVLSTVEGKPASALYDQLNKLRGQLKSTFTKVDRGTTLTPAEEAKLASFNAIKSTIDTVSPEVRALNTLENQMYTISKGLAKSAKKGGIAIPGMGKVGGGVTQALKDASGSALESVSSLPDKINNAIPKVDVPIGTGLAMSASDQTTPMQVQDTSALSQPTSMADTQTPSDAMDTTPPQAASGPFGKLTRQEIVQKAFKAGLSTKQIKEVTDIYDQVTPVGAGGPVSDETMKVASSLRQEYISRSKENKYMDSITNFRKIQSTPATAAGDLSLIFAYMKLLDPTSVVRESEQSLAQNATSLPGQFQNYAEKVANGQRLNDQQRSEFRESAKAVFDQYKTQQSQIDGLYKDLSGRYGIDPSLLGIGVIGLKE